MRFIFINQFYPPDFAPTGRMVKEVAGRLAEEGHEVEVWCSGGSYGPERNHADSALGAPDPASPAGVAVVRIGGLGAGKSACGKLVRWLGFYLLVAWRLLGPRGKSDRLVALTTPPFLSVLARMAASRHGARHCHWLMDLYPDALVAHGVCRDGGLAHRALAALARFGMGGRQVGAVVTLGPCMAERARQYTTQAVAWVPLWAEVGSEPVEKALHHLLDGADGGDPGHTSQRDLRRERGWRDDELVLLYSGNLGRGHLVTPLLDAALALHRQGVRNLRWVFTSHGPRSAEVSIFRKRHPDLPLEFMNPVNPEILATHLMSADIHLASLEPAWCGCMVPSKIQGSFAVGRPVLFVGPPASSPARWIESSGGGWVVDGGDPVSGLVELLRGGGLKDEATRRGANAGEFSRRHFDRATNAAAVAARLAGD
jgi:glycosyltransferase involved in cell wall biosynthesis